MATDPTPLDSTGQYGIFTNQAGPQFSFKFPLFEGWKAGVVGAEVHYFPTDKKGVPLLTRMPKKIEYSGFIKQNRTAEWTNWWNANAKKNPFGIEIAMTNQEKKTVLSVDHHGSTLEIKHDLGEEAGFSGKTISTSIFNTLQITRWTSPFMMEILPENIPATSRVIDTYKKIKPDMSMKQVIELCGLPDGDGGSGVFILLYELSDGSQVRIKSTPDRKHIWSVVHSSTTGKHYLIKNDYGRKRQSK